MVRAWVFETRWSLSWCTYGFSKRVDLETLNGERNESTDVVIIKKVVQLTILKDLCCESTYDNMPPVPLFVDLVLGIRSIRYKESQRAYSQSTENDTYIVGPSSSWANWFLMQKQLKSDVSEASYYPGERKGYPQSNCKKMLKSKGNSTCNPSFCRFMV